MPGMWHKATWCPKCHQRFGFIDRKKATVEVILGDTGYKVKRVLNRVAHLYVADVVSIESWSFPFDPKKSYNNLEPYRVDWKKGIPLPRGAVPLDTVFDGLGAAQDANGTS